MEIIATEDAPKAIGPYSQAIKIDKFVFISGQIPLKADTMEMVNEDIETQATQVFKNLRAVARAAGGDLNKIAKLTIYLIDLKQFDTVNQIMMTFFGAHKPARAVVEVSGLPRQANIEAEALMVCD